MEIKELYFDIKRIIQVKKNYIERQTPTIGGMWTVDTYKMLDAVLQIMDEGYTSKIFTTHLELICHYDNKIEFIKGGWAEALKLLSRLEKDVKKKEQIIQDSLVAKHIELSGEVFMDEYNEGSYEYYNYGELNDKDKGITLQNVLLNNIGRKAKITIEFEDMVVE